MRPAFEIHCFHVSKSFANLLVDLGFRPNRVDSLVQELGVCGGMKLASSHKRSLVRQMCPSNEYAGNSRAWNAAGSFGLSKVVRYVVLLAIRIALFPFYLLWLLLPSFIQDFATLACLGPRVRSVTGIGWQGSLQTGWN